jgi:hypothetical protein
MRPTLEAITHARMATTEESVGKTSLPEAAPGDRRVTAHEGQNVL